MTLEPPREKPPYSFWPHRRLTEVGWTGGSLWHLRTSVQEVTNYRDGNDPGDKITLFITSSNVPGLAGLNLKGAIQPSVPPPNLPTPEFRRLNAFWAYSTFQDIEEDSEIDSFEIIDRGRYVCATPFGMITDFTDSIQGNIIPLIINWNIDPFSEIKPPPMPECGSGIAAGHCRTAAEGTFGQFGGATPWLQQILNSHFETTSVTHRDATLRNNLFINVDLIKSLLLPDVTEFFFTIQAAVGPDPELIGSWSVEFADISFQGLAGFEIAGEDASTSEGFAFPINADGEELGYDYDSFGEPPDPGDIVDITFRFNLLTDELTIETSP
jgi:hypothetical protein